MADVAVADPLASSSLPFGRICSKVQADAIMKRKTPSELRGEQLKRRNSGSQKESLCPIPGSDGIVGRVGSGGKKSEPSKIPKYIDTRVNDVFPVRKSSDMFRVLYGKEKSKADSFTQREVASSAGAMAADNRSQLPGEKSGASTVEATTASCIKDGVEKAFRGIDKCGQTTFRTVAELSTKGEKLSESSLVDMDKALKGMVVRDHPTTSYSSSDSLGRVGGNSSASLASPFNNINIPGQKTPLDLTLKATIRFVCSSSLNWCHRLGASGTLFAMTQYASQFGLARDESVEKSAVATSKAEALYAKALYSWVYPQSPLPPSVISAMTLSASRGETDFLLKRQLAWEDSFRNLYYMLRKKMCDIFYMYTSQFVVMFIGFNTGKRKRSCHAYLSQSTRGLRSLLREHDISFTMPLCRSEVEEATTEDLVELSEIEKFNLGETRRMDSISNVDNSSQSLLEFTGNDNVHGLYDFLLNYRSFLSSLTTTDVPILYSPVPFQNGSLNVPEVKCKEMKRADAILPSKVHQTEYGRSIQDPSAGVCYSLEIKDTVIPPWTVSGLCESMCSQGNSFEASFHMDPISAGLNVAFDAISRKSDSSVEPSKDFLECNISILGQESVVSPCLRSASLKSLKYSDGSYTASLMPV
ncbi:hypothetical protein H6P81_016570 [Aristolochia fimbriata]|uniref:Protein downstream neighbor of Son n=1 Tax=Aristolochia fimbriata TaxID=158543 RepID=A0AAV7E8M4_ARIFI|nr:hypothetical protein H6P81_016570 [Aristolochia fimbriata]